MKYDRKKLSVGLLSLLVVLACAVSGTLAWISTTSGTVTNTFTPAKVTTEVDEDTTTQSGVKQNVKITNTGDVDAYIRAAVVINLVNDAENDAEKVTPATTEHYTMSELPATEWNTGSDGFYYYSKRVPATKSTANLFDRCEPTDKIPEGWHLQVTIIAEGIQADGVDAKGEPAVTTVWPVDVANGVMTPNKNS